MSTFINKLSALLLIGLFAGIGPQLVSAADFTVTDELENDISVQVYPADGERLIIWLVDHDEQREMFEDLLNEVNRAGFEIWRVDLLADYFLPRSSENERTMPGDGVKALLRHAHQHTGKQIMLAAYDRMPLTLLRGVYQWQQLKMPSRLSGAVLFYPNLFGPAPVAGEDPVLDPVVKLTNIPVVIYQPEAGSQRWRLNRVIEGFWQGGAAAHAYLVPDVRDWFFMGVDEEGEERLAATRAIPAQLHDFARVMDAYPKPAGNQRELDRSSLKADVKELVRFKSQRQAPGFSLQNLAGEQVDWEQYRGRVVLLSFWATWCPPCVEEVPSLNNLAARYLDTDFSVVSIDYRETREQLQAFSDRIPVDFPVLFDFDGQVSLDWKVFSFPSTFIIDRSGRIRYSANRAIDWDTRHVWEVIDRLLAESAN